ncbi:MAG: ATP-grasp domain-containing protein [Burkholderiales bacterium]|nr:ATP-grasp domain-containing protein [Burkholderiales bacterium]
MNEYILFINFRRQFRESISAFNAAHQLGYKVLVVGDTKLPEMLSEYVDKFVLCKTNNLEELLPTINNLNQEVKIVSVVCFTETAVESSAIIAATLKLPGLPIDAIKSVRNKDELRKRTAHIDKLPTRVIVNDEDINTFIQEFGLPVIIKPINTSGSTGIYMIKDQKDLEIYYQSRVAIANPIYDPTISEKKLTFVIEKYIDGQEVSVEGFVYNKKVTIVGITHKVTSEPFKLEICHISPANVDAKTKKIIEEKTTAYVLALGLNNTSFHLEGKYKEQEFSLIEVAARPGGCHIDSHIVPLATGYDFYKNLIRVTLGIMPDSAPIPNKVAGEIFILAKQEGLLKGYNNMDQVINHPWVSHVFTETSVGTYIELPPKDFRKQRLLGVISTAPSHEGLLKHLEWISQTLTPIF